jgi:S1-C subfamily serine protease
VWPNQIWVVPAQTDLVPGSFVFTRDALLAGLVIDHDGRRAIVPGEVLLAEAERLLVPKVTTPGHLGIDVQPLTPPVARATGAVSGVVVTRVDASGPAAGRLAAGDVLEAADGDTFWTLLHWDTRAARLAAGEAITLRVRRGGELREVALVAAPPPAPPPNPSLGLALRGIVGTGAAVVKVDPGSVAEKAGLLAGDVITRIADIEAPSSGQIRRTFAAAADGQALLVALMRGDAHRVTALEK